MLYFSYYESINEQTLGIWRAHKNMQNNQTELHKAAAQQHIEHEHELHLHVYVITLRSSYLHNPSVVKRGAELQEDVLLLHCVFDLQRILQNLMRTGTMVNRNLIHTDWTFVSCIIIFIM